jgi:hypothetical protein
MSDKDRLTWKAKDLQASQCAFCAHKKQGVTCSAFPKGIPNAILLNQHDHRQTFRGDNGVLFKPVNGEATSAVEKIFGPSTLSD